MKHTNARESKRVTLLELNKRPGEIVREVHFSKSLVIVTAHGKPIAELRSITQDKRKSA